MYYEYDIVMAKVKINDTVLPNTRGTILLIYEEEGKNHYEVEFVDKDNNSICILTVESEQIVRAS